MKKAARAESLGAFINPTEGGTPAPAPDAGAVTDADTATDAGAVTTILPPIDAFIFDFGKVITKDPDRSRFTVIADLLGAPHAEFLHAYGVERHEYDRGVLSAGEYWTLVASHFGARLDRALLDRIVGLDMDAWFNINPDMVRLLRDLRPRAGRLLLLSNINVEGKARLLDECRVVDGFDWLALFDGQVFSCDLKLVKPERAIFDHAVALAGVPAERCLFVDDTMVNVLGARAAGLQAVEFRTVAEFAAQVEPLFVQRRA